MEVEDPSLVEKGKSLQEGQIREPLGPGVDTAPVETSS